MILIRLAFTIKIYVFVPIHISIPENVFDIFNSNTRCLSNKLCNYQMSTTTEYLMSSSVLLDLMLLFIDDGYVDCQYN
jgi:hypothetical protein